MYFNPTKQLRNKIFQLTAYKGNKFQIVASETFNIAPNDPDNGGTAWECWLLETNGNISTGCHTYTLNQYRIGVRHDYFCGHDCGITIYVHPTVISAYTAALPASEDLTEDEKTVLKVTASCKSSYAGDNNYRCTASGLRLEQYNIAKADLIAKGLLTKSGALSLKGKNVVTAIRGY